MNPITLEHTRVLRRFFEMACQCGVYSLEDGEDWTKAQEMVPEIADFVESILQRGA